MEYCSGLLDSTVGEVLRQYPDLETRYVLVPEDVDLTTAVKTLLSQSAEVLVVVDQRGKPRGIITDLDLLHLFEPHAPTYVVSALRKGSLKYLPTLCVSHIMEKNPPTVPFTARLREVIRLMLTHHTSYVIVTDDEGRVHTVLSSHYLTRKILQVCVSTDT